MRPEPESGSGTLSRPVVALGLAARRPTRAACLFLLFGNANHTAVLETVYRSRNSGLQGQNRACLTDVLTRCWLKKKVLIISAHRPLRQLLRLCAHPVFFRLRCPPPQKRKSSFYLLLYPKKRGSCVVQDSPALQGAWA